jgi:hypothetical protein
MVNWIGPRLFRRVYSDAELVGKYDLERDMADVRKGLIRTLQQGDMGPGLREQYEKILMGGYEGVIDKIVDDIHSLLGL